LQEWDALHGRTNLSDFDNLFSDDIPESEMVLDLPKGFRTLATSNQTLVSLPAKRYLRDRGLTKADILKWKIGYVLDGPYKNRVIVPSFNANGELNYFVARSYVGDYRKYINPPASRDICFNELYVDWDSDLAIVEGIFDAFVAGNSVPILGSSLRKNSKLIRRIVENDTPVYIALDADAEKKAAKIIQTMLQCDIELYRIDVSGYEDVGSMTKEEFAGRKANASPVDSDSQLMQSVMSI